jgi:hypothetical protein
MTDPAPRPPADRDQADTRHRIEPTRGTGSNSSRRRCAPW